MHSPTPLTVRARPAFQLYLWALTLFAMILAGGVLLRALAFAPLIPQEPTLLALFLPVGLLAAVAAWLGRWALFHATARIAIDADGLAMRSAVATDALRWADVEAIRLQATSGNEAQLAGRGHRVTLPSGSAVAPALNQHLQDWITFRLNDRDLHFGDEHFWGP